MITEIVIGFLISIPYIILYSLQGFDFNLALPNDIFNVLKDLTVGVAYVVPVAHFLLLFNIRVGILIFKCVWSLVIRLKSFIPTFGS